MAVQLTLPVAADAAKGRTTTEEVPRLRWWTGSFGVLVAATLMLFAYGSLARHGPALADEHIYLAGARFLAETGSLNARFYDYDAILKQGHPHQDAHSPGFVLFLGALMFLLGGDYWTAVALNVLAYVAGALLLRSLCRSLGLGQRETVTAVLLFLALPALLPYVFWVMPEVLLAALFLFALAAAAREGPRVLWGLLAALGFGLALLVRETALFGLPAVAALLWPRRRLLPFSLGLAGFVLLVYAPLNTNRAGGPVIWRLPWGADAAMGTAAAVRTGDLARVVEIVGERTTWNLQQLVKDETPWTEKGALGLYLAVAVATALTWRRQAPQLRRLLLALLAGWLALVGILMCFYVIVWWDGFRFLMTLMPAFLPALGYGLWSRASASLPRAGWRLATCVGVVLLSGMLLVDAGMLGFLNQYKLSRQRRWDAIASYVDRHLGNTRVLRIALQNGWAFGLRRYPVEVISSVPKTIHEVRALEKAVAFDYLVLPGDTPLADAMARNGRFRRINVDDDDAPLLIYRRREVAPAAAQAPAQASDSSAGFSINP